MIVSVVRWILSAPVALAMNLIAILLSPVLSAMSILFGVSRLPFPLNYFHTNSDDLDGGQHQNGWPKDVSKFGLWKQRMAWICRNPAQTFHQKVLGISCVGTKVTWRTNLKGKRFCTMVNAKGQRFWSYQRDFPISSKRYIKIWIGWHWNMEKSGYHMLKTNFNPFKTFGGK